MFVCACVHSIERERVGEWEGVWVRVCLKKREFV